MEKKNAVVGQSGGPTAAINATLAGVISESLRSEKIDRLVGMRHGFEGIIKNDTVLLNDLFQNENNLRILLQTPAAALGSCRIKLPPPEQDPGFYQKIFSTFSENNIGYFFYIGGNDSMDTVNKLCEYAAANSISDIRFIGIPKTIDNDLMGTDHTPGYGSAAKYIATSVAEIVRDCSVYTVNAVTIVEIMGRDAGWLTASAALAGAVTGYGADYIYLPETIFSDEALFRDIENAFQTHPNVVIAVSEGLRYSDGSYVGESAQSRSIDAFGHKYLAGTGKTLEGKIRDHFGCKVRTVEVNILQRCAAHLLSKIDIEESFETGKNAVQHALKGETGVMVCAKRADDAYRLNYFSEKISKIANRTKTVPPEFINKEGNGITAAGLKYMMPLIQGEMNLIWEKGLPKHITI